jgi:hypothetical protein
MTLVGPTDAVPSDAVALDGVVDKVSFAGIGTVQKIKGDLIDVTSLGSDPEFTLGNVTVALVANGARVEKV